MKIEFDPNAHFISRGREFTRQRIDQRRSPNETPTSLTFDKGKETGTEALVSESTKSKLRLQQKNSEQNHNAISILQVSSEALNSAFNLLCIGKDLVNQTCSDTMPPTDRTFIQIELDELLEELDSLQSKAQGQSNPLLSRAQIAADSSVLPKELHSNWLESVGQLMASEYGTRSTSGPTISSSAPEPADFPISELTTEGLHLQNLSVKSVGASLESKQRIHTALEDLTDTHAKILIFRNRIQTPISKMTPKIMETPKGLTPACCVYICWMSHMRLVTTSTSMGSS